MPLSFANPALLFGALAAAVPVIIHFLSRRRIRRQPFSDLRFLDQVQTSQARSLGVRRWLLLLLRVLAILMIALGTAGPRWGGLAAAGGARSVLFLVDRSASMGTQTGAGTRGTEAAAAVRAMIASLPGDASVQIAGLGATTEPLLGDWLPAGTLDGRLVEGIAPGDGPLDLTAAVRAAARLVRRAPGRPVEIVLIGDLQEPRVDAALDEAVQELRAAGRTRLLLQPVDGAPGNGAVLEVALPQRALTAGEGVTLVASVLPDAPDQVFRLDLDGRTLAEAVADGPPAGVRELVFPLTVPGPGLHLGRVHKASDALAADDSRPFVLEVPQRLQVLLVHGRDRAVDPPTGRGGWRILAQALAPAGGGTLFAIDERTGDELDSGALAAADLLVVVDPDPLGRRALSGLEAWLRAGGSALFVVGEATGGAYLEQVLLPLLGLPPTAGYQSTGAGLGQRLRLLDRAHPVFAGLEETAVETFEEIRCRRWFRLDEGDRGVLLELIGGDPLLIEGALEQGRFALLPLGLLPAASDLAASPMALPFFQRLAAWLARGGGAGAACNTTVGAPLAVRPLRRAGDGVLADAAALRVLGDGPPAAAVLTWQGDLPLLGAAPLERTGFAVFTAGGDTVGAAAAAVPARESTAPILTPAEWAVRTAPAGLEVAGSLESGRAADFAVALAGRPLAPWFFLAAVLLLLVESALARGAGGADRTAA